ETRLVDAALQVAQTLCQLVSRWHFVRVLECCGRLDVAESTRPGLELLADVERVDLPFDREGVRAGGRWHHVAVVRARRSEASGDRECQRRESTALQIDRERLLETLDGLCGSNSSVADAHVETVHETNICGLVEPADDELIRS